MTILTAQTICDLARQIAKCPGYTTQSGNFLNMILEELAQSFDFESIKGTFNFNLASGSNGPYALPADWYRGIDKSIFYTISGVPYPMVNIEEDEFDNLVTTAGLNGFPIYYMTDMSQTPPTMSVWPPASGAYPVTARYFKASPTITTPETSSSVPWFPSSSYLLTRLAGELMKITNDDRVMAFLGNADEDKDTSGSATDILRKYMKMEGDRGGKVHTVQLDRRLFGFSWDRLPNTKQIGW
jgi:hypothetical protein